MAKYFPGISTPEAICLAEQAVPWALKQISEHKQVDEKMVSLLLKRKLIEEEKEDIVKRAEKYLKQGEILNLPPELIKTGLWKVLMSREQHTCLSITRSFLATT